MPEIVLDRLVAALVESLEQMAFIMVCPLEGQLEASQDPVLVSVEFTGPVQGRVELLASKGLGAAMAANMLAGSAEDSQVVEQADDTLRELLNVTCGALLNEWTGKLKGRFRMQIPKVAAITRDQWEELASASGFSALDADGHAIAVRLVRAE